MTWKPTGACAACVLALVATTTVRAADPPAADDAAKQASPPAPGTHQPSSAASKAAAASQAQPAVKTSPVAGPATRRGPTDRLELDTSVVTGNRELPKVLYIVPWKKADLGELPAQPYNTLLDEVLRPVDRDVFRREVTYYDAVAAGAHAGGAVSSLPDAGLPPAGTPAGGSEK